MAGPTHSVTTDDAPASLGNLSGVLALVGGGALLLAPILFLVLLNRCLFASCPDEAGLPLTITLCVAVLAPAAAVGAAATGESRLARGSVFLAVLVELIAAGALALVSLDAPPGYRWLAVVAVLPTLVTILLAGAAWRRST